VNEGEPYFALIDLEAAWGVARKTLFQIIDRHPEIFSSDIPLVFKMKTRENLSDSKTAKKSLTLVNEQGLYSVMVRINVNKLSNLEARKAIHEFQKFVPELLQKFRKGHLVERTDLVLPDEATQYFEQQMHLKESVVPLIKQYIFDYGYDV
jgi:prophage antirepressor-like protein